MTHLSTRPQEEVYIRRDPQEEFLAERRHRQLVSSRVRLSRPGVVPLALVRFQGGSEGFVRVRGGVRRPCSRAYSLLDINRFSSHRRLLPCNCSECNCALSKAPRAFNAE